MSIMKKAMEKVIVVGAGMTGASVASQLAKELKPKSIKILDKGRGAGGRMATARSMHSDKAQYSSVDLGAQYISITPEYRVKHQRIHEELISLGILSPFKGVIEGERSKDGSPDHYVTPDGSSSLVKHFLQQAGADVLFSEEIKRIDVQNKVIKLSTQSTTHECSSLVLTMPVPQILAMDGDIQTLIDSKPNIKESLKLVSYSSRFCVGLFFNQDKTERLKFPWEAKYFDDPIIRFVSIDPRKRGRDTDKGLSVCVHTSVPFTLQNLEKDKDEMAKIIVQRLHEMLPDMPSPDEIKGHKWRFSQVHKGYPDSPGCVVLSENPPIILAGDAFTHSNMDGCIASALAVKELFMQLSGKL